MLPTTRREFLTSSTFGVGSLALAWLLNEDRLRAEPAKPEGPRKYDLMPRAPHFTAKAQAMISLFMQGGPSHLDLFDPKPELDRLNGTKFLGEVKIDNAAQASSVLMASPWKFQKRGQCGMDVS